MKANQEFHELQEQRNVGLVSVVPPREWHLKVGMLVRYRSGDIPVADAAGGVIHGHRDVERCGES